jgi:class 3 adenylate cyclase
MADPPVPDDQRPPDLGAGGLTERVADTDRDRTVTQLREHVVEGRLTLDEFSERVGLALEARIRGDLQAVMADLPEVREEHLPEPSTAAPKKKRRWHVAVMSGHSTKGRWRISGKTTAVAIMGGCDMDLRRAEIDGPEVEITAVAFWGGIDIIVPEGFDVELRGFSFMGGRELKLRDVPIVRGSPRIVVRGFAVMGGIDVKSRPNRSGKRLGRGGPSGELGDAGGVADPGDLATLGHDIRRQLGGVVGQDISGQRDTERRKQRADKRGRDQANRSGGRAEPDKALPADGTVTILFCDMVDYAGMTERLGDLASREILREHHRIVRDAITRHGGREINVQGDGFMVAFGGVARALRCAVDIQRSFRANTPADGSDPIAVHIGIHTGDALDEGDDYLGHTVIVASRLADAAGAGEILVSSLSEQLVQGSGEFTFDGHRETRLKGMARAQLSATLSWVE